MVYGIQNLVFGKGNRNRNRNRRNSEGDGCDEVSVGNWYMKRKEKQMSWCFWCGLCWYLVHDKESWRGCKEYVSARFNGCLFLIAFGVSPSWHMLTERNVMENSLFLYAFDIFCWFVGICLIKENLMFVYVYYLSNDLFYYYDN